jgi:hypothetical protein
MALTDVNLFRIDGTVGSTSNLQTSALNDGPLAGTRNRIINGDMRIDQRNAGAAVTVTANNAAFTLDRFRADAPSAQSITVQRSATAPAGFTNSLLFTAGTGSINAADVPAIQQFIEGFNVADLGWGSSAAQAITISFWVRSSLTGNFGLSLRNSAGNRTYVATFNIAAANTFEAKSITVPGDTSGTWLTDNGRGIVVQWDMGIGTTNSIAASSTWGSFGTGLTDGVKLTQNTGATFYLTGVQLEPGTVATPFERRSYGQELALCQRYYQHKVPTWGTSRSTDDFIHSQAFFKSTMRITPTLTLVDNAYGQTIGIQTSTPDYYVTAAAGGGPSTSVDATFNASAEL